MREDNARIALIALLVVFSIILSAFRKKITYPFCTLEKYTGKVNSGKSTYFLLVHILVSFGLCLTCYAILNDTNTLGRLFEDTITRLTGILLIWLVWILIIGWLIELYLVATDKEYKSWKLEYLKTKLSNRTS